MPSKIETRIRNENTPLNNSVAVKKDICGVADEAGPADLNGEDAYWKKK